MNRRDYNAPHKRSLSSVLRSFLSDTDARASRLANNCWSIVARQGDRAVTLESMFYLSQTVAAFAIVGSLLFVALEVRGSNQVNRHRAIEELLADYRGARLSIASNDEVARAWLSGLHNFEGLNPVDKVRFSLEADLLFHTHESFYMHYRGGRMSRALYEPQRIALAEFLGYPGLQTVWALRKRHFHGAYQSLMDEAIKAARSLGTVPDLYGEKQSSSRNPSPSASPPT
jgi:hypothetical protein